ncbi:MAG: pseudaminic acid cytidylyltransferase [Cellvibrionaceae bacterium]
MRVAIIPARGGSKRIPRKNIKAFHGKPMIARSIEAAKASGCFDRIIVSTDDDEIATIAKQYGAEVPFVRPEELANDHAGTVPVIKHAVDWLQRYEKVQGQDQKQVIDYACCIYATAPFIEAQDIQAGLNKIQQQDCDYCVPVTTYAYPIQRALKLSEQGQVSMFQPENFHIRSQDLEEAYHDVGQFYWGAAEAWLNEKPLFNANAVSIVLPRERVQDIDTEEDWQRAEKLFMLLELN